MSRFQDRWYLHPVVTAVYQGVPYRAGGGDHTAPIVTLILEEDDPVPEGLERYRPDRTDRVYIVHPQQLDAWYDPRWTFRWRGEPFDAIGSSNGWITGWYQGGNFGFAMDHLVRTEAMVFQGNVPLDEITDLTEHRTDLLARWKEQHQR